MKNELITFCVLVFCMTIFGQRENTDTLFTASGAIDTTVYRTFKRDMVYLELDISTFSDGDTIDIGYSADKKWIGSIPGGVIGGSSIVFPLILDISDWEKTINGPSGSVTKSRIGVVGIAWSAKYIAIDCKCSAAGCTPVLIW